MIKHIIAHLVANGIALYFVGVILVGKFEITGSWKGYLICAIIFGLLNGLVKPILKLLSLDVLKFDGVAIVITGGFFSYLLVGFLMSLFNMVIHWLLKK